MEWADFNFDKNVSVFFSIKKAKILLNRITSEYSCIILQTRTLISHAFCRRLLQVGFSFFKSLKIISFIIAMIAKHDPTIVQTNGGRQVFAQNKYKD